MKKIAVITGASSGMGKCFALQAAEESSIYPELKIDEMWIVARRKDRLLETKKQIDDLNIEGLAVKAVDLDISGSEGAKRLNALFTEEKEKGGFEIRLLINNAGFGTYGEFTNTSVEREMEMIDLNCTSLTGITGYAIPYMTGGSRIIMTASLASFAPLGNFAVYGGTKAYVLSFAVALAAELKPKGISVTSLCPGSVSTEFANVASRGARKEVLHGLSPEKTVRQCLKDSRKKKLYSLWAFKWKVKANLSKFVSRRLVAWFTFKYSKRPSN